MSGRGRGRGRGRGALPPSVANTPSYLLNSNNAAANGGQNGVTVNRSEPQPTFPVTSLPEPLDAISEEDRFALRQAELLTSYMRTSPFYLAPSNPSSLRLDRYSDKYLAHLKVAERKGKIFAIDTDLSCFPAELQSLYDPEKAKKLASLPESKGSQSFSDALAKLKQLEKSESEQQKDGEQAAADDDEGQEDEVVYDEEEFEDETDYNFSYFDNGEDYGDHDDGDDGPVY